METEFYKIESADAKHCTHNIRFKCDGLVSFEDNGEIEVKAGDLLTFGINDQWELLPRIK